MVASMPERDVPNDRRVGVVRRAPVLSLVFIALVVASCGGDDDGGTDDSGADGSGADDSGADGVASPGAGDVSAVVVIGGDTYDFEAGMAGFCLVDENGIFKATVATDSVSAVDVSLPPDGYEAENRRFDLTDEYASVEVRLPDGEWLAHAYESDPQSTNNRNIPEGQTLVDSYEFDASGASGTATFLHMDDLTYNQDGGFYSGEPTTGSFEISCG